MFSNIDPTEKTNGIVVSFLNEDNLLETLLFNMIGERVTGEGIFIGDAEGLDVLIDSGAFVNYLLVPNPENDEVEYMFLIVQEFRFIDNPLAMMKKGEFIPYVEKKYVELMEEGRAEFKEK